MQRLRPLLRSGRPARIGVAAGRGGDSLSLPLRRCFCLRPTPQRVSDRSRRAIPAGRLFSTTRSALSGVPEPSQSEIFTWAELDIRRQERRQQEIEEQRRLKDEPLQPLSPGAALIDGLAREPIVPRPTNLSVLVEPAMEYEHRSETFHSRMRHGKSVFRQERLEVIRQAQQRPLPDWRIILQRLAAATPGKDELVVDGIGSSVLLPRLPSGLTPSQFLQIYNLSTSPSPLTPNSQQQLTQQSGTRPQGGQYRKHAVSFALPGDSKSIQELLNGVDGTLWKISKRSGSVLRLYRRNDDALHQAVDSAADNSNKDNDSNSNTDYPWLLTLSGNKPSIFRAASEVTFFLKDAVPVAVNPNVRLDDLRTEQPSSSGLSTHMPLPAENEAGPQAPSTESESSLTQTWSLISSSYYLDDNKELSDYVFSPHVTDIGAHEIPRPAAWTRKSFEQYVAALVNGRPPAHLAAQLYPQSSGWPRRSTTGDDADISGNISSEDTAASAGSNPVLNSHDRTVVNLLHDLFDDDAVKDVLSLSAFKMALAFISKHGEIYRPEARALFVRAEWLRIRMDTETFNILLASLVKTQDLRNFGSTLALMENRGYTPDLTTWVLFLRLFESEEVKRHILHAMQSRGGLLDSPEARHAIAQEMVEYDALRAVSLHRRKLQDMRKHNRIYSNSHGNNAAVFLDEFITGQTERYGAGWLTRPAANQILEVFASHGQFAECQELLGILTRKQNQRNHIEQLKTQQKQQQQLQQPGQRQETAFPNKTANPVAAQALNTTSFNIVLTHAKLQYRLRSAFAIIRQMDGLDYGDQQEQDRISVETQRYDLVPTEATTPVTTAVTRVPLGNKSVPADATTYYLLQEMAYHRRLAYTMGALWAFGSILRRTNHHMNKKVGRVLSGDTGPQTARLAKVLRGKFEGSLGQHSQKPDAPFATVGSAASARWAAYYDGWEPAVPLGQVLEEALDRDNALLKDRFDQSVVDRASRPPPPPLRIPLRRKLVTRGKGKDASRSRGPAYNPDGGPAYIDIQPDWMSPKGTKAY